MTKTEARRMYKEASLEAIGSWAKAHGWRATKKAVSAYFNVFNCFEHMWEDQDMALLEDDEAERRWENNCEEIRRNDYPDWLPETEEELKSAPEVLAKLRIAKSQAL